jgi:hypothetical protein
MVGVSEMHWKVVLDEIYLGKDKALWYKEVSWVQSTIVLNKGSCWMVKGINPTTMVCQRIWAKQQSLSSSKLVHCEHATYRLGMSSSHTRSSERSAIHLHNSPMK